MLRDRHMPLMSQRSAIKRHGAVLAMAYRGRGAAPHRPANYLVPAGVDRCRPQEIFWGRVIACFTLDHVTMGALRWKKASSG